MMDCHCFFLFKQKTAYEMRISDWSSDVCSSDLQFRLAASPAEVYMPMPKNAPCPKEKYPEYHERMFQDKARIIQRSEEHTSELQSLMRISYAVFRLKNKTVHEHMKTTTSHSTRKRKINNQLQPPHTQESKNKNRKHN